MAAQTVVQKVLKKVELLVVNLDSTTAEHLGIQKAVMMVAQKGS